MQKLFETERRDTCAGVCPYCGERLASADINVAADTALCRSCGAAYRFSELIEATEFPRFQLTNPPEGATFDRQPDGFTASATTRSAQAWFLVPFMLVWSGGSLGGIYGGQIARGQFELGASLFGIPFILGAVLFGARALMSAAGEVVVGRNGDVGFVFQGVGPIGWTKRFRWSAIASAVKRESVHSSRRGHTVQRTIALNLETTPPRVVEFGSMLTEERRQYLLSVIRSQMAAMPPAVPPR